MSNHVPDVLFGLSIYEKRDARARARIQKEIQAKHDAKREATKAETDRRLKETNVPVVLVKHK
jgi:hypothetical protein